MGKVQRFGSWVPHLLSEKNKNMRSIIASNLLTRHRRTYGHKQRFLYRIITGDEKWCLYLNVKHRKEWVNRGEPATPRPKQDLHPRKTMISVWWDYMGIIHYEMLEKNKTVDSKLYAEQLSRLNEAIQLKRPDRKGKVILQHDNARPHTAQLIKEAIKELKWEIMQNPPYSPNLAPSDYHLFRSLSNQINGVTFNNDDELRSLLDDYFSTRPADFYRNGIHKLVERWEEVVNSNGEYIIDLYNVILL